MGNIAGFFEQTLRPIVVERSTLPIRKPLLLLDESVNSRALDAKMSLLCRSGDCDGSDELWQELRQEKDGTRFYFVGGPSKTRNPSIRGYPVKGASWPDRNVADLLVGNFMQFDRLVLLTENRRRDKDGLWRILHEEIKPALQVPSMSRLGLLVIFKRGKASHSAYAESVVARIRSSDVAAGFNSCLVPVAA